MSGQSDSSIDTTAETTIVTTTTSATTSTTTVDPSCCQSVEVILDGTSMEMVASDDQFVSDSHHLVSLNVYGRDYWVLMRNWHPVFSPSGITVCSSLVDLYVKNCSGRLFCYNGSKLPQ